MGKAFTFENNFVLERIFMRTRDSAMVKVSYDTENFMADVILLDERGKEVVSERMSIVKSESKVSELIKFGYVEINMLARDVFREFLKQKAMERIRKQKDETTRKQLAKAINGKIDITIKNNFFVTSKEFIELAKIHLYGSK